MKEGEKRRIKKEIGSIEIVGGRKGRGWEAGRGRKGEMGANLQRVGEKRWVFWRQDKKKEDPTHSSINANKQGKKSLM